MFFFYLIKPISTIKTVTGLFGTLPICNLVCIDPAMMAELNTSSERGVSKPSFMCNSEFKMSLHLKYHIKDQYNEIKMFASFDYAHKKNIMFFNIN